MSEDGWESEAANWIAWTRAPGHNAYWLYFSAFAQLLPAAADAALEIGCGEGRVARDLAAVGLEINAR